MKYVPAVHVILYLTYWKKEGILSMYMELPLAEVDKNLAKHSFIYSYSTHISKTFDWKPLWHSAQWKNRKADEGRRR